jgi:hypothetical protein
MVGRLAIISGFDLLAHGLALLGVRKPQRRATAILARPIATAHGKLTLFRPACVPTATRHRAGGRGQRMWNPLRQRRDAQSVTTSRPARRPIWGSVSGRHPSPDKTAHPMRQMSFCGQFRRMRSGNSRRLNVNGSAVAITPRRLPGAVLDEAAWARSTRGM